MAALKSSIWSLFNRSGCNTPAGREAVGSEGITDSNILTALGLIEQRTNDLMMVRKGHMSQHYVCINDILAAQLYTAQQ